MKNSAGFELTVRQSKDGSYRIYQITNAGYWEAHTLSYDGLPKEQSFTTAEAAEKFLKTHCELLNY